MIKDFTCADRMKPCVGAHSRSYTPMCYRVYKPQWGGGCTGTCLCNHLWSGPQEIVQHRGCAATPPTDLRTPRGASGCTKPCGSAHRDSYSPRVGGTDLRTRDAQISVVTCGVRAKRGRGDRLNAAKTLSTPLGCSSSHLLNSNLTNYI